MSTEPNDYSDFHGDGDNSIVLDHGGTSYWTKKATVWSVSMIAVSAVVGAIIILMMYGVI